MNKSSRLLGFLVGQQIAGQRRAVEKVPVAYLYNGVRLPALPEWDRSVYPYAMIEKYTVFMSSAYILRVFAEYDDSGAEISYSNAMWSQADLVNSAWGEWTAHDGGTKKRSAIIWSNFDILNEDGTVYMPKSEPVPVYE
jgi:hypothetical protein